MRVEDKNDRILGNVFSRVKERKALTTYFILLHLISSSCYIRFQSSILILPVNSILSYFKMKLENLQKGRVLFQERLLLIGHLWSHGSSAGRVVKGAQIFPAQNPLHNNNKNKTSWLHFHSPKLNSSLLKFGIDENYIFRILLVVQTWLSMVLVHKQLGLTAQALVAKDKFRTDEFQFVTCLKEWTNA